MANDLRARAGVPVDEIEARWVAQACEAQDLIAGARVLPPNANRREFFLRAGTSGSSLAGTDALDALVAASSPPREVIQAPTARRSATADGTVEPRIVIVGAGLAGLTAAYRLQQAGHAGTIYEGDSRIGGRVYTLRGFFANDDTVELGAEFINSDHHRLRDLTTELGLSFTDLWTHYRDGMATLSWYDGKPYPEEDIEAAFDQMHPAARRDFKAAGSTMLGHGTPAGRVLDSMTMSEWIEREVDGGLTSQFGTLLDVGYSGEFGLDLDQQSALNLVIEAGSSTPRDRELYGYQDWKWRVEGGNDRITSGLGASLPEGSVVMGTPLVAVRSDATGTTTLTFEQPNGPTTDVVADIAIMALPFTTLREVDLDGADWSPLKRRAIAELGMGINSKCQFQFTEPIWYDQGWSGDINTERPLERMLVAHPVNGAEGILDNYRGGSGCASYPADQVFNAVCPEIAAPTLDELDKIVPGAKEQWNGKAYLANWGANPWSAGSYFCPRPGQYSAFVGAAGLAEGKVSFCGEHTSVEMWSFMEGAVETGERAAAEAIDRLGRRSGT